MSTAQREPQTRAPQLQSKLRSSCDACGQAKIKCDRGRPACSRCVAQGLGCMYGISRKAGKPPRRRLASPPRVQSVAIMPDIPDMGLTGNEHSNLDMMLSLGSDMAIDDPFSASHDSFSPWFSLDSLDSPGILEPAKSSTATATPPPATRQSCTQESKDIMRRLYCANPSAPISDGVPACTLDLGSVLTRNRDVVGRLGLLLNCPCARLPHTAMLYASIVSRVLLWYKQAVSNTNATGMSSCSHTPEAQGSTPSSSNSASLNTFEAGATGDKAGASVLPTPVTVGTFQSRDHDLQAALTNTLILSELQKVGSLIDSFFSLGAKASSSGTTENACPAAVELGTSLADGGLVFSLGSWLQTEYNGIVAKARPSSAAAG